MDADYPGLLKQIHDPPALLYARGHLPTGDGLATFGSRHATPAGLQLTRKIAAELAQHNLCIISGLARGVDSAAYQGALEAGEKTIGVLGCGIDRIYPPENAGLFKEILQNNAVITEYPPGARPMAGHFPVRNRIISGLCRGVMIVEAQANSGSLITGDFALEQGRELLAIPGAFHHPKSTGTNRLLKEGAQLVTEAADIIDNLWPGRISGPHQEEAEDLADRLTGKPLEVYLLLGPEPIHERNRPEMRLDSHGGFRYFTRPRTQGRSSDAAGKQFYPRQTLETSGIPACCNRRRQYPAVHVPAIAARTSWLPQV